MWLKKESLFFFLITDFISVKDIKWGGGHVVFCGFGRLVFSNWFLYWAYL